MIDELMYDGRDEGQIGNFVSDAESVSVSLSNIYMQTYFGIAFKATLMSHFERSASVTGDSKDRKAYI